MQLWRMGYKFAGVPARDVSLFSLQMLAPWPANDLLCLEEDDSDEVNVAMG